MKTKEYTIYSTNFSHFGFQNDYGKFHTASNNKNFDRSIYTKSKLLLNDKDWLTGKGRGKNHPTFIAQQCMLHLTSYWITDDIQYLNACKKHVDRLINEIAVTGGHDSQLWYPYDFNFYLHGRGGELMQAPWYSGMCQGDALSIICRLYSEIQEDYLLSAAEKTFNTFDTWLNKDSRWVSCYTDDGYYWIEEYPHNNGTQCYTLNGFIFAIFGLYEYYIQTKNPRCKELLLASLYTVEKKAPEYLCGALSNYCNKHKTQTLNYHRIHTSQLKALHQITQDVAFLELYKQYHVKANYWKEL